jgi:hypothetical protein
MLSVLQSLLSQHKATAALVPPCPAPPRWHSDLWLWSARINSACS